MRLSDAIRRLRHDERGTALPESIVAILIAGASISVIAAAVIGTGAFQANLTAEVGAQSSRSFAEANWRADVQRAIAVLPKNATEVAFTTVDNRGFCQQDTWALKTIDSRRDIVLTRSVFTGAATTVGCSGTVTETSETTMLSNVSADTTFQYRNRGGRLITFSGGVPTYDTSSKPATVSAGRWNSSTIGSATLNTTSSVGTAREETLRVTQITSQAPSLVNAT